MSFRAVWWGASAFEYISDALMFAAFVLGCCVAAWWVAGRFSRVVVGVSRRDLSVFLLAEVVVFAVWGTLYKLWAPSATVFVMRHGDSGSFVEAAGYLMAFMVFLGLFTAVRRFRGYRQTRFADAARVPRGAVPPGTRAARRGTFPRVAP